MTKSNPRIAVVGCGGWGQNHLRTWHSLGALEIACDPDPARREEAGRLYDVATVASLDEVLSSPDIDGVVLATPAVTHADLAVRILRAGKHVLVEKPLATTVREGEAVVAEAARAGLVLMVGHVLEYHPAFLRLRQLVAEGALGRVRYLYSNRLNFGKVRTEENALWSFAPHDLALFLRLLGALPNEVSCRGVEYLSPGVADVTLMGLSFPSGVQGHIFVSWMHPFKEHRFVVVGDRQMAVFDDTAPWAEKLVLYPHRVEWMEGRVPVARRAEGEPVPVEEGEPLRAECMEFLNSISTGDIPLTDGHSGLEVLRLLDAGERSLRSGAEPVVPAPSTPAADVDPTAVVHETAIIDPTARVGPRTKIWHFAHVMPGAHVGADCSLGQNVFVGNAVSIGDRVKVQNNVSLFEGVVLEDGVFCGPSAVFTNVFNPRAEVERKTEYRPTIVERGASIGANATIVCGNRIGRFAFVGAGSVVTADVEPHALVYGSPARRHGWMCECGEKLPESADGGMTCHACGLEFDLAGHGLERR